MGLNTWQETRAVLRASGPALASSTTDTSVLNADARTVLGPDDLNTVGKQLKIGATGRISTTTGTNTLAFSVRFGSVIVANPALTAITLVASQTNVSFWLEFLLTMFAVGSSTNANLMWQSQITSTAVGGTSPIASTALVPATAPAVGTGFDSTAAQVVDLFAKWSVSSASNSVQLHEYRLEVLN